MQFSLRQLLMVFPAFLIAWGVGIYLAMNGFHLVSESWYYKEASFAAKLLGQRNHLRFYNEECIKISGQRIPPTFYCGKKAFDMLFELHLAELFELDPITKIPLDDSGRPLQVRYDVFDDSGELQPFAVYSFGRDGISLSNGEDTDDIASWSHQGYEYYHRRIRQVGITVTLIHAIWLTPIIYGLLYKLGIYFSRLIWGKKSEEPVVEEAGHALDADS